MHAIPYRVFLATNEIEGTVTLTLVRSYKTCRGQYEVRELLSRRNSVGQISLVSILHAFLNLDIFSSISFLMLGVMKRDKDRGSIKVARPI